MNTEYIKDTINKSISTKKLLLDSETCISGIHNLAERSLECLKSGGKIILAGNGGSFGDAQHISAEFTSRFLFDRSPLASIALGTNNSAITAIGNDYGYDNVFSRELEAVGRPGDLFIAITTSGNSKNVVSALQLGQKLGCQTVGLTGRDGGAMNTVCDVNLIVPSDNTPRIQEMHILFGHTICQIIDDELS